MKNAVTALESMLSDPERSESQQEIRELLTIALRWSDEPPSDNLDIYIKAAEYVANGIRGLMKERAWAGRVDWDEDNLHTVFYSDK